VPLPTRYVAKQLHWLEQVLHMKFIDPATDPWRDALDGNEGALHPAPGAQTLFTLERWLALAAHGPAASTAGLRIANTDDIEALKSCLQGLAVIALHFPKWTDGRAYSQARLLRTRFGFGGEIRATGDVLVDMLPLLVRTGFDAAVLRADQKLAAAQRALGFFTEFYQGDAVEPRPLFAKLAA
jgi:uncharacterized protein (DUF934 family)